MSRAVAAGVVCLGVSSVVAQMVALRESLNLFAGNELVIGVILGNWLMLTGAGSYIGRVGASSAGQIGDPTRWIVLGLSATGFLAPGMLMAIRAAKSYYAAGIVPGMGEAMVASMVILAPYCLVSGFLLTVFTGTVFGRGHATPIGDVYVLDTAGGVAGGALFSFCLVSYFSPFQSLTLVMILNLLSALWIAASARRVSAPGAPSADVSDIGRVSAPGTPSADVSDARRWGLTVLPMSALLLALAGCWTIDFERRSARMQFPGQDLVHLSATPYGAVAVTRHDGQINIYENGVPVASSEDVTAAEETVHYALAQRPKARRVLLVSGSLTGAIREAAKYPVERIDNVELDPAVIEIARRISQPDSDPRVVMAAEDARRFIRRARGRYDAILIDLPDPSNAQLNRYYTAEFFSEARRALAPGGVLGFRLSGSENYASPEMRRLESSVRRSCASVFKEVLVIPGARQFFIASDEPVDYRIAERLEGMGIETRYVNRAHLSAKLTDDRIREANERMDTSAPLNRDFFPEGYYAYLRYWSSHFGEGGRTALAAPALLMAVLAAGIIALLARSPRRISASASGVGRASSAGISDAGRISASASGVGRASSAAPAAICATGFAGMGLELVLIIAFQICYGYVYREITLIVTAFMAGSAIGAAWSTRRPGDARRGLFQLDASLAVFAFVLAPVLEGVRSMEHPWIAAGAPAVLFPLLTGLTGFLAGAQFSLAAKSAGSAPRPPESAAPQVPMPQASAVQGVEETAARLFALDFLGAAAGAVLVGAFLIPTAGIAGTCYVIGAVKLASAFALRPQSAAGAESQVEMPADSSGWASFGIAGFVFAAVGTTIALEETAAGVYALSFVPAYHWVLMALLAVGIVRAMEFDVPAGDLIFRLTKMRALRWANFAAFSLAVFYPIFRCYFKVPYLFCHACPRKCVFGYLRPFLVPAALIMNLEKRHWCYHACPIGTFYDCQARSAVPAVHGLWRWPGIFRAIAFASVIFTAAAYFKVMNDLENPAGATAPDWYTFFYKNTFSVSAWVLGVTAALIALAWRLRRTFCEMFCPVGAVSDWMLRLDRLGLFGERRAPPRPAAPTGTARSNV